MEEQALIVRKHIMHDDDRLPITRLFKRGERVITPLNILARVLETDKGGRVHCQYIGNPMGLRDQDNQLSLPGHLLKREGE